MPCSWQGALVREMEAAVAAAAPLLRECGFRKQRHRFNAETEPDLTQVLTFQMGAHQPPGTEIPGLRENLYGAFTINLGLSSTRSVRCRCGCRDRRSCARKTCRRRARERDPKSFGDGDCHRTVRLRQLIYNWPPMCKLLRLMVAPGEGGAPFWVRRLPIELGPVSAAPALGADVLGRRLRVCP